MKTNRTPLVDTLSRRASNSGANGSSGEISLASAHAHTNTRRLVPDAWSPHPRGALGLRSDRRRWQAGDKGQGKGYAYQVFSQKKEGEPFVRYQVRGTIDAKPEVLWDTARDLSHDPSRAPEGQTRKVSRDRYRDDPPHLGRPADDVLRPRHRHSRRPVGGPEHGHPADRLQVGPSPRCRRGRAPSGSSTRAASGSSCRTARSARRSPSRSTSTSAARCRDGSSPG